MNAMGGVHGPSKAKVEAMDRSKNNLFKPKKI
jgi:hypothetical protein